MSVYAAEPCEHCGESTPRPLPDWRCPCCSQSGAAVFAGLALLIPAFVWPVERDQVRLPVHVDWR